jgi:phosphatidylglycerophosphatase A
VGTVPGVIIWYFLAPHLSWPVWIAVCVVTTVVASYVGHRAGPLFGVTDAREIVIDELAGTFWTLLLVPHGIGWAVGGFLAFRLFDITKPWPASYFDQQVKNGFGVTMDDVVAGWYACGLLHLVALGLQHL